MFTVLVLLDLSATLLETWFDESDESNSSGQMEGYFYFQ